jgi:hypothetical protein
MVEENGHTIQALTFAKQLQGSFIHPPITRIIGSADTGDITPVVGRAPDPRWYELSCKGPSSTSTTDVL